MAVVKSIAQGAQTVKVHPTQVDMFYQVVLDSKGHRFLHLTTFGSESRTSSPKSSQSIQLDEARAEQLAALINETFGF